MRAGDLPTTYNACEILQHNLGSRASKTALTTPDRSLTFAEADAEASRVANALRRRGVRVGDTVGLLCLDTAEWATSFFGCLKAGAVAVGMNTLLTPGELAFILNDARPRVLVVHAELLQAVETVWGELPYLEQLVVVGGPAPEGAIRFEDWIRDESDRTEVAPTHRDDFATLNYSSGTTGRPKGIFHAHKDLPLTAELWGVRTLGLREEDRTFSVAKLFFVYGLGGNLVFPWYVGASVVLFPGSPRQAPDVLAMIDRFKPTVLFSAPTAYASALAQRDLAEAYDLDSLRICVSAGEALPAPLWKQWKERVGVDILDGVGSTENFHIFLSNRPDDIRPGSSGKPVDGYELRIVDEDGHDLPAGDIGNLWVKGETAALFYLHDSERSRHTFRGEWLHTGDKYRVDGDGYYWHAGRSDDMLKVGGIWVSPVEVESTLIGHEAVLECAVIGAEDDAGLVKPKAFVVTGPGFEASEDLQRDLTEHCVEHMAAYKRPRWIEFMDELPKTATGKIQRYKLR
jgi:benzoate-CoA ligase family protein